MTHLGDTHGPTLALGLVSLALVLGLRRLAPVVPGSLVAVLFGIVVVGALGLDDRGVDIVGHIDSGQPSLDLPDVAAADYLALAAVVIAAVIELIDIPALVTLDRVATRRLRGIYGVAARST